MFKLRLYHETGSNKGNLKEEKFFDTFEELHTFYMTYTKGDPFGCVAPTAWIYNKINNHWYRIQGY